MTSPQGLKYTKEHEWARMEGDIATVGITDHAQELLTDIVFVELPEIGKTVTRGGSLAVVESVKSVSDVFSPVSGEVVEVNQALEDSPELVNRDAYGQGWIAKIRVKDRGELDTLMGPEEYDRFITE
ncbi:MAG: glycine cleavage system protein GcvH [Candidatus Latescibacterota bacterium]